MTKDHRLGNSLVVQDIADNENPDTTLLSLLPRLLFIQDNTKWRLLEDASLLCPQIFARAMQRRCGALSHFLDFPYMYIMNLGLILNADTIYWRLDSKIGICNSGLFSKSLCHAIRAKDIDLCRALALSFRSRLDRMHWKNVIAALAISQDEKQLAMLYPSLQDMCPSRPLLDILDIALKHTPLKFCRQVLKLCAGAHSNSEQEEAFQSSLANAIYGKVTEDKLLFLLDEFRANRRHISWSKFYTGNEDQSFSGDLLYLQRLVKEGLPITKSLLISCAQGHFAMKTLPWIIDSDPGLLSQLTDLDLRRSFSHSCCFRLDTPCTYQAIEVFDIFESCNVLHRDPWLTYLATQRGKILRILKESWPCKECWPITTCLRSVYTAIGLDDICLIKQLIVEGFAIDTSTCSGTKARETPLRHAICRNSLEIIERLLEAGADPRGDSLSLSASTTGHGS